MNHIVTILFPPGYRIPNDLFILSLPFLFAQMMPSVHRNIEKMVLIVTVWGVLNVLGDIACLIIDVLHHKWGDAAWDLGLAMWVVFIVLSYWKRWKDRKKALKLLGAKTKALLEKVMRKMREGTAPQPVRIPS